MKALLIIAALSLGVFGCSKKSSNPSFPGEGLPELTGAQEQELVSVSGSVGDMNSVSDSKIDAPGFRNSKSTPSQGSQTLGDLDAGQEADADLKAKSQKRLEKAQLHLDDSDACSVEFKMNDQDFGSSPDDESGMSMNPEDFASMEDIAMSFELLVGGPACDISMSSKFEMKTSSASQTQMSVGVSYDSRYETRGEFKDLFEVHKFQLVGESTTTLSQASENSGTAVTQAQFTGTGQSVEKGDFQIEMTMNGNFTMSGAGPADGDSGMAGTLRSVVNYSFPDFQAVMVTDAIFAPNGEVEYKYFVNGKEIDQNDPEAMAKFQSMTSGMSVPQTSVMTDLGSNSGDSYEGDED